MTYDPKLLARARVSLEEERERNKSLQQRRAEEIARIIPEIPELEARMRSQMAELVHLTLSRRPDLKARLEKLRSENLDLQMRRAELLSAHGYPIEYLDEIVSCPLCRDTGLKDGAICSCVTTRYNRELTAELAVLLKTGDESFENFDLNLYPSEPDPVSGYVPREAMEAVFNLCRRYADQFPRVSTNLLFRGGTGLGKTYLSACIARKVAEKGHSVCYDSISAALEAFEKQRFARDPSAQEEADARVRRMLSCDLMILDDLGTEMISPVTLSALYTLINTRLNAGLRTIISTNCTDEEMDRRYTPQICSRIRGEFTELPFAGRDIRLLRKGR